MGQKWKPDFYRTSLSLIHTTTTKNDNLVDDPVKTGPGLNFLQDLAGFLEQTGSDRDLVHH